MSNCPQCSSRSLIMNFWGYPDEAAIEALEAQGYKVKFMGCTPPEIDEHAFLYECRECGHKFGDYEDGDEN